jgi:hypothetical protein
VLGEALIVFGDPRHHRSRDGVGQLLGDAARLFRTLAPMIRIVEDGRAHALTFASARRPASVIHSVPISIVSWPARTRCGVAVARPERTRAMGAKHMLAAVLHTAPGQQLERTAAAGLRKTVATACGDPRSSSVWKD